MEQERQSGPLVGWSRRRSLFLSIFLSLALALPSLVGVFLHLGWGRTEDEAVVGAAMLACPFSAVFVTVATSVAFLTRRVGGLSLLPVVCIPLASVLAILLFHGWVEASQEELRAVAAQAARENGFFMTAWLWERVSWQSWFLALLLPLSIVFDLALLPFVVFFDPDVIAQLGVVVLRVLSLTVGAGAVSALLWGPLLVLRLRKLKQVGGGGA